MRKEEWKNIEGFEGEYKISKSGEVISFKTSKKGVLLKKILGKNGYFFVALSKNGKVKHYYIHRLVAEAFIPNPENKPCIDHINCNKTDNMVDNLRWVTHMENSNNPKTKDNLQSAIKKFWDENGEEQSKKLSEAHKGKQIGENNPFFGRKHSEETKMRMSEKKKGYIPWNKGKKMGA